MRKSGKNSRLPYMIRSLARTIAPTAALRRRLPQVLAEVESRADRDYIFSRADYYNKLLHTTSLPPDTPTLGDFTLRGNRSAYFFDAHEYTRWFDPSLRWMYLFGDVTHVPDFPTIVKSRPIRGENANSVLLNLDKVRHFTFLRDTIPFADKADRAIFRGHIIDKPHRIRFMELYHGHPRVSAGIISPTPQFPTEWVEKPITLWNHLTYKYILAIEGNDVASNLKWIMSSNSLAVMPRPTYETWFMEGTLQPGVHYVEIAPDYSDLIDKMDYYMAHPAEAEAIISAAHTYIDQFRDPRRERLISLLVLERYFERTDQK